MKNRTLPSRLLNFAPLALICPLLGAAATPVENAANALVLISLILLWLSLKAGRLGLLTCITAICPGRLSAPGRVHRRVPVKCFLIGLLSLIIYLLVFLVFARIAGTGAPGAILVCLVIYVAFLLSGIYGMLLGTAAIYLAMGRRTRPGSSEEASPSAELGWRDTLRGGSLVEMATLVPVAGCLVMAYLMLSGLGASVLCFAGLGRALPESGQGFAKSEK